MPSPNDTQYYRGGGELVYRVQYGKRGEPPAVEFMDDRGEFQPSELTAERLGAAGYERHGDLLSAMSADPK